uniref:Uncharacterized protein n=1 Tax=Micrurus lemniscatus lemniscatus TaxID=129467 RepID=A0A2D4JHW0_MICLE
MICSEEYQATSCRAGIAILCSKWGISGWNHSRLEICCRTLEKKSTMDVQILIYTMIICITNICVSYIVHQLLICHSIGMLYLWQCDGSLPFQKYMEIISIYWNYCSIHQLSKIYFL